jgi:hypothetical protein
MAASDMTAAGTTTSETTAVDLTATETASTKTTTAELSATGMASTEMRAAGRATAATFTTRERRATDRRCQQKHHYHRYHVEALHGPSFVRQSRENYLEPFDSVRQSGFNSHSGMGAFPSVETTWVDDPLARQRRRNAVFRCMYLLRAMAPIMLIF